MSDSEENAKEENEDQVDMDQTMMSLGIYTNMLKGFSSIEQGAKAYKETLMESGWSEETAESIAGLLFFHVVENTLNLMKSGHNRVDGTPETD